MAEPRIHDWVLSRKEIAGFIKDPGTLRNLELLQYAVRTITPADVATAQTAADAAQTAADTAEADAQTGITNAAAAQSTANTAVTAAAAAQATANSALAAANVQTLLDGISSTRGVVLYRGASAWSALSPGTVGNVLTTNGASADPSWGAVPAGSGGSAWTLAGSWTWSTNVTSVPITGLGSYNELVIIVAGVTAASAGVRRICASVDGGTSYFSTAGNYTAITVDGVEGSSSGWSHSTSSTSARGCVVHILNTKGDKKVGSQSGGSPYVVFTASSSDINAIRLDNSGGGNLTAGSMLVYGR